MLSFRLRDPDVPWWPRRIPGSFTCKQTIRARALKISFRGRQAQPDAPVCCRDKFTQSNGVHLLRPAELHVPHASASALQEAGRIVEHRPVEEADIHMGTEGIDVPKRRISHTRSG